MIDRRRPELRVAGRFAMFAVPLVALAVIAMLASGAMGTLSQFTASIANTNTQARSGTVLLTQNTAATAACSVGTGTGQTNGPLFPGNASSGWSTPPGSDAPCTLGVTYEGTLPGFVGLDVLVAASAGILPSTGVPPGTTALPLFDRTAQGLQLQITDTTNGSSGFYIAGTDFTAQGGSPPPSTPVTSVTCPSQFSGATCFQVTDLLVSTTAFVTGRADTFSVNYQLPLASTTGYQNSTATVVLTAHAVQAGNNALPANCAALVQCSTGFSWS